MKKILFIFTFLFVALGVSAQYSGPGPLTLTVPSGASNIQWFKDGVAIQNQTSTSYVASTIGTYYATYTDAESTCTDDRTMVFVLLNRGEKVVLDGTINNSSGTGHQWYNEATPIAGATSPSYTTTTGGLYQLQFDNGTCVTGTERTYVYVLDAPACTLALVAPTLSKN